MRSCHSERGVFFRPQRLTQVAAAALTSALGAAGAARADVVWSGFAGDAQHTAISSAAAQPLDSILWQTPVDLDPQYSGNDLYIHYGSPVVTAADTVIVPVKTGALGGFEVQAHNATSGAVIWSQTTDYVLPPLPPNVWTPSYSPALTPSGQLAMPGVGGTVNFRDNPDSATGATGKLVFFGQANYAANPSAYNNSVYINTPITTDAAGNMYFGYTVTGPNPLNLQSGIARISASGVGSFVSATAASGDAGIGQVVANSAPALSPDGKTVYVAVSSENFGRGDLLALNSTTLATNAVRPLIDPSTGQNAALSDDGTASPTVGPDGRVYFGVLELPPSTYKGWLLSFGGGNLSVSPSDPPGAFGWDDTASIVPSTMVPSYHGTSPYLLMTKDNNYVEGGGDGVNQIAILDPTATMKDPRTGATVMQVVESIAGPTHDPAYPDLPDALYEWCINSAAVDPSTDSIFAGSEDGSLYRWDLATNTFTQEIVLTPGIGEAYTPTLIAGNGEVFAINDATLFAVGSAIPEPSTFALLSVGALAIPLIRRRAGAWA